MKRVLLFVLTMFPSIASFAQSRAAEVVSQFGNNISKWCQYANNDYKIAAIRDCAGHNGYECLVYDALMKEFELRKNRVPDDDYLLSDYLLGFESTMYEANGIRVIITNIKEETEVKFDNESLTDEKRKSLYYVSCDVIVSGAFNFTSRDVFCIRKGSGLISQIAPYVGVSESGSQIEKPLINTSNIMDWNHIADGEFNSFEVSYGYSKNFPLNVGIAASLSYFNIGVEYGQNFDNTPIISKKHTNFAKSQLKGNYYYLMASPGVFLRYATISYGFGATVTKYKYESIYPEGNKEDTKAFFVMKPKISFNLPLPADFSSRDEKMYLCPYVGYIFAPKLSDINSFEVGIGLRFRFNN